MSITEEQYEHIAEELDSQDFFQLSDFADVACINIYQDIETLHGLSKQALDSGFGEDTQKSLSEFLDEIEGISRYGAECYRSLRENRRSIIKS